MLDIMPFGPCTLHDPLAALAKKHRKRTVLGAVSFRGYAFCLSVNETHQLLDYLTGDLDYPSWINEMIFRGYAEKPPKEKGKLVYSSDFSVVEISTPVQYDFEGVILNINRVDETISPRVSVDRKLVSKWRAALMKGDDQGRAGIAEEIWRLIPKETEEQRTMAELVRGLRSRILDVDDITRSVADLRDRMNMPMGMILNNWSYMPDGRAVSWPAGFKADCAEVARRLDLPTHDHADFVIREGARKCVLDDLRHWSPSYYLAVGEEVHAFASRALGEAPPTEPKPARKVSHGKAAAKPEPARKPDSVDEALRWELADLLEEDALLAGLAASAVRGRLESA